MRAFAFLIIASTLGCPSAQPTSETAPPISITPTATATTSAAPLASEPPDANVNLVAIEPPDAAIFRGKPHSFGGGIPGQCINCPPTGCPKSCSQK